MVSATIALLFAIRPVFAEPAFDQLWSWAGPEAARLSIPPALAPRAAAKDNLSAGSARESVDPAALKRLLERAKAEHSDAIVILKDGKVVVEEGFLDQKIYAMSATKSIASLAIGCLIEDGRIRSLDQKVSDFVPEWRQGEKQKITIRMLLNHTSGIGTQGRGASYAVQAPQVFAPGEGFAYNNPAVDLLALVIREASGMAAEKYFARRLFEPLGIIDWDWAYRDGLPLTAGELMIRPPDLARIGQMVLDGGVWNGKRIISKAWLDLSAQASQTFNPTCGLLWWLDTHARSVALTPRLLETWKRAGVRPELIDLLRPLVGRTMSVRDYYDAVRDAFRGRPAEWKEVEDILQRNRLQGHEIVEFGPVEGFLARGFLGQFLVIDPARRLVGVRMRNSRPSDYPTESNPKPEYVDGFDDFPDFVHALTK